MLEDQDDGMPVDPHNLKVEVLVRAGQHHAVEFTTVVEIDITQAQEATNTLRDAVEILRKALPLEELKAEDREHLCDVTEMVSDPRGKVRIVPLGATRAERTLERLKKEMPPEKENGSESELPSRA